MSPRRSETSRRSTQRALPCTHSSRGSELRQLSRREARMKLRNIAWILILIVDVGYIAWGAGAALAPDHLLGPGGKAILPAGYEGYSGASWSQLAGASPFVAGYMTVLYRMYGIYNVLFGVMGSIIAVTAFRRGEAWAWWALLVGNTVALASAI